MTRGLWSGTAAFVAAAAIAAGAAQKVVGPEEFDQAMKTVGAALEAVEESLASAAYEEAKTPLALARQVLASTRPEWEAREQPAAVRLNREAVAALDALDRALSAIPVDTPAAAASFEAVTRACDACHSAHRDGDPQSGYRIRASAAPPD